jgi:hypothetical protein
LAPVTDEQFENDEEELERALLSMGSKERLRDAGTPQVQRLFDDAVDASPCENSASRRGSYRHSVLAAPLIQQASASSHRPYFLVLETTDTPGTLTSMLVLESFGIFLGLSLKVVERAPDEQLKNKVRTPIGIEFSP